MSTFECFKLDILGQEIVDLKPSLVNNEELLKIQRYGTLFLCTLGFFLNSLLAFIIIKCPSDMQKMRPIFWFEIILNLHFAVINFINCPLANISHGRFFAVTNGIFEIKSHLVNGFLMGLFSWVTITSWICLPCQFVFRFYVIKFGERPRGKALFIFVSTVLLVLTCSLLISQYFYAVPNSKKFYDDSVKINEHYGYFIPVYKMHGAAVDGMRFQIFNAYLGIITISSYTVIIYCALQIRKITRNAAMSAKTKRLHSDLNKVLLALSLTPIISTAIPTAHATVAPRLCENYLGWSIFVSWCLVSTPVLNSLLTLTLVTPYRRMFKKWVFIGLKNTSQVTNSGANASTQTE